MDIIQFLKEKKKIIVNKDIQAHENESSMYMKGYLAGQIKLIEQLLEKYEGIIK